TGQLRPVAPRPPRINILIIPPIMLCWERARYAAPRKGTSMDLTYKIVRRLLRDQEVGFSRNQNFDAYEDPRVQRARRIFRHLRSVENDLLKIAPGDPQASVELDALERDAQRIVIRLVFANSG